MPLDEFNDLATRRRRADAPRTGRRNPLVSAVQTLIEDTAYFWWAFAGLGAIVLLSALS